MGILPAVVFNINSQALTVDLLQSIFSRFEAEDDVFSQRFTKGSVLIAQTQDGVKEPAPTIPTDLLRFLNSQSSRVVFSSDVNQLPEGPYFIRNGNIHQAWRLYADESRAFVTSLIPVDDNVDDGQHYK